MVMKNGGLTVRLLICAGGTGGGVYPALAVLNALPSQQRTDVLWVGGEGGMEEELVKRAGIPYRSIPAAGVHGVGLRTLPANVTKLARGVAASRRILREFKPSAILFTGGYVAAPMAVAGYKVPTVLYVPDIEPGLALKFLSYFADVITLTAPASQKYFSRPKRIAVTGYPLRADLQSWTRERALKHLGLSDALPTLLVTGGSKGARSLNTAVMQNLKELLGCAQVIHISGALDWEVVEKNGNEMPAELKLRYHAMPYLHEMGAALAAADLVVSRAGASTLGEYPLFGLPAVLVPYPYAWRYQKVNADYLAEQNAAVILQDEMLSEKLLPVIRDLLLDKGKLGSMGAAMRKLSLPTAAYEIASQLVKLAGVAPS
jgi:UDP-N-acetylglucosamine--N-acetylmuramyl-(pentapeptide) pyrophosphoryl-undecaprenol N-acetylglucosamine transferase